MFNLVCRIPIGIDNQLASKLQKYIKNMRIWWIFLIMSQSPMVTAESPSLSIEANSSYITVGDTVVINCSVHNITLLSFLNGYTLSWWKDDVKLTTSSIMLSEDLKDTRHSIAIDLLGETVVSILKITNVTSEDDGLFKCELKDKENTNKSQALSIKVNDMSGTLEDGITMTTQFSLSTTSGNNTDMASFTQDLTQPSENDSQLLTDTESLNTFAAENTSSNVYTQLLTNTTAYTESLNTFAAENTSSNVYTQFATINATYNESRSTTFENITPSMFREITTSVSDDLMNYTDKEDKASSDVTSLSNVTDMGENATDSIIINTAENPKSKSGLAAGISVGIIFVIVIVGILVILYKRSHHQHGGNDGSCLGTPRNNQYENYPLREERRRPGYEDANEVSFLNEYENNRPRSVASVESTDEITSESGPVHLVHQSENNEHSNHSLGELKGNQRGFPPDSNEEEEMPISRKESKPKRKGRSNYESFNDVIFLSEYK
ncbi:uncharacterized protein LOC111116084 isoform X3 [Crassostrea virginica]